MQVVFQLFLLIELTLLGFASLSLFNPTLIEILQEALTGNNYIN
jgi:hypothetical protein